MQCFYRIFGRCLPGLVHLSLLTNCQVRENLILANMPRYARVHLDRAGDRALDYLIPDSLAGLIAAGSRVRVPLRARLVLGTVVDVLETTDVNSPREIHEIIGNAPMIRPKLIEIARWISEYYCCPLQTAMGCVLPQVVRQASADPSGNPSTWSPDRNIIMTNQNTMSL